MTYPVGLLNTSEYMNTCWMNSFCQLLMNIECFVNEFKNMSNLKYLRKHKPLLKLIYNLVRKFTYVHPKYYSLTKSRYASVEPNNFTAIIPCELMEFLERKNVLIGEEQDAGRMLVKFLQLLSEEGSESAKIILNGYREISVNEKLPEIYPISLIRVNKPYIPYPYNYPIQNLRGILLFENKPVGHWNAFVKCMIDNKWRKFNDREVTIIENIKDVENREEAVILCYERKI